MGRLVGEAAIDYLVLILRAGKGLKAAFSMSWVPMPPNETCTSYDLLFLALRDQIMAYVLTFLAHDKNGVYDKADPYSLKYY
jgi:hypothetical protein